MAIAKYVENALRLMCITLLVAVSACVLLKRGLQYVAGAMIGYILEQTKKLKRKKN